MKEPTPHRFILEKEGEYYFVRDTVTEDRLAFKSTVRADIDQMIERLNTNYEEYVNRRKATML